jgi:hypothetical protein
LPEDEKFRQPTDLTADRRHLTGYADRAVDFKVMAGWFIFNGCQKDMGHFIVGTTIPQRLFEIQLMI